MEAPKHIKTMRSVSSPPGMPPLSTATIEPSRTPTNTKPLHTIDSIPRQSKKVGAIQMDNFTAVKVYSSNF
ncbi:hypothetical protein CEXT_24171 [Caerostris extrusa]|uniref:Uncharacterized protein n=1 Tax=Caerostris extrusa TaxID=172846 RepID=A0AAV4RX21_CAEEX|nr:hypothetical protein CEXT_24171 [Caerostris extrusa]